MLTFLNEPWVRKRYVAKRTDLLQDAINLLVTTAPQPVGLTFGSSLHLYSPMRVINIYAGLFSGMAGTFENVLSSVVALERVESE